MRILIAGTSSGSRVEAARDLAGRQFSFVSMAANYEAIYREAIVSKP